MMKMTLRNSEEVRVHKDKDTQWSLEDTGTVTVRLRHAKSASSFDPYQGTMSAKQPSRKRDLRRVEEWLKAKRRAELLKLEESDD